MKLKPKRDIRSELILEKIKYCDIAESFFGVGAEKIWSVRLIRTNRSASQFVAAPHHGQLSVQLPCSKSFLCFPFSGGSIPALGVKARKVPIVAGKSEEAW